MQSDTASIGDMTTGVVRPFQAVQIPSTTSRLAETADLYRKLQSLIPKTADRRRHELIDDWEKRKHFQATRDGAALLHELSDYGMAWRDVARLVGVSVPAVQKWRRGEGITGQNRLRLAGVVALLECLEHKLINEPVSWLEMPTLTNVSVSQMDILAADRYDLVLELAADDPTIGTNRTQLLDEFDADWRTTRVDNDFEVFEANDGHLSIRPRK